MKTSLEYSEVFKLITVLIIAAEAEGIMCDQEITQENEAALSAHKERLEDLRECILILFDKELGGDLHKRKQALEYLERSFKASDKLLVWLWGENRDIFNFDGLAVPEGATLQ